MLSSNLLLLLLAINLCTMATGSYEEETTFTEKERAAIPQFKKRILPRIPSDSYVNNWVDDDLYLVRWLRAKNGKIDDAVKLFNEHMKWRANDNVDKIDDEDWSDMKIDIPIFTDGVDKMGQPVSELWFAEWQTRKAVLTGKLKRVVKWVGRMFEMENRRLYQARRDGKRVSQAMMILDLEGFTILQQGCPSCLPVYIGTTTLLEQHYPGLYESMNFCNMPSSFDIILRLVKPLMRASTRKTIQVYVAKSQWLPLLDEKIDRDQRSIRFGGTVERPNLH